MKKQFTLLLLTICFVAASPKSYGQYRSLVVNNSTVWTMIPITLADWITTDTLMVTGDAYANGQIYKRIDYLRSGSYTGFFDTTYYVREDTVSGKAWMLNQTQDAEIMIYDMSLQLNDTFRTFKQTMIIDSVYYFNGLKHLSFHSNIYPTKGIAIEGVGLTLGFPDSRFEWSGKYSLMCQFKDGTHFYKNDVFPEYLNNYLSPDECSIPSQSTSINVVLKKAGISLYPNPSSGAFAMEMAEPFTSESSVVITDISGREIKRLTIPAGSRKTEIYLEQAQPGMYLLILEASGHRYYQKIIIRP